MMLQLNPPVPVETPLGRGDAVGWIDYGNDYDLQWIVMLDESRIVVTFRQPYIRAVDNLTMGRAPQGDMFLVQRRAGRLRAFDDLIRWLRGDPA